MPYGKSTSNHNILMIRWRLWKKKSICLSLSNTNITWFLFILQRYVKKLILSMFLISTWFREKKTVSVAESLTSIFMEGTLFWKTTYCYVCASNVGKTSQIEPPIKKEHQMHELCRCFNYFAFKGTAEAERKLLDKWDNSNNP